MWKRGLINFSTEISGDKPGKARAAGGLNPSLGLALNLIAAKAGKTHNNPLSSKEGASQSATIIEGKVSMI